MVVLDIFGSYDNFTYALISLSPYKDIEKEHYSLNNINYYLAHTDYKLVQYRVRGFVSTGLVIKPSINIQDTITLDSIDLFIKMIKGFDKSIVFNPIHIGDGVVIDCNKYVYNNGTLVCHLDLKNGTTFNKSNSTVWYKYQEPFYGITADYHRQRLFWEILDLNVDLIDNRSVLHRAWVDKEQNYRDAIYEYNSDKLRWKLLDEKPSIVLYGRKRCRR